MTSTTPLKPLTYTVHSLSNSTYTYRKDGSRKFESMTDCGHRHKTLLAAVRCMDKLYATRSTTWFNCEVRDSRGNAPEQYDDAAYYGAWQQVSCG